MDACLFVVVNFALVLGAYANPKEPALLNPCETGTGKFPPASCPRTTDPDGHTTCCEIKGEPGCCLSKQMDNSRHHTTCPPDYQAHGINECPMPYMGDAYTQCCSTTIRQGGQYHIDYKCCIPPLANWAIAVIVIAIVVVITLITLCICCWCSCCWLARRRANYTNLQQL